MKRTPSSYYKESQSIPRQKKQNADLFFHDGKRNLSVDKAPLLIYGVRSVEVLLTLTLSEHRFGTFTFGRRGALPRLWRDC